MKIEKKKEKKKLHCHIGLIILNDEYLYTLVVLFLIEAKTCHYA